MDINVLSKIKTILPVESMMNFSINSDLGNKFSFGYVKMMHDFFSIENHLEYIFQHTKLEELRVKLINSLKELDSILVEYSDRVGETELFRIRRSLKSDNPELYTKVVRDSNNKANTAWKLYNDLISLGRQLLGE